jgi:glycosyltransferase involved in cell wall biosynthesis
MKKRLSLIIPAHNEEERIEKTILSYLSFLKKKLKEEKLLDFEIIVVLNACKDNTLGVVNKIKDSHLKILEFSRGGKGFAIKEGFKDAFKRNSSLIGFVDADGATSAEEMWKLVENIGVSSGIIASRYLSDSVRSPKQDWKRILVSRLGNLYIRTIFLLPFKDTQCGAKLFERNALKKILWKLGMSQWGFDVELLYQFKKNGFKIKEYPTVWRDVKGSKLNVKKASTQALLAVTQLRLINSPFKFLLVLFKPLASFFWRKFK